MRSLVSLRSSADRRHLYPSSEPPFSAQLRASGIGRWRPMQAPGRRALCTQSAPPALGDAGQRTQGSCGVETPGDSEAKSAAHGDYPSSAGSSALPEAADTRVTMRLVISCEVASRQAPPPPPAAQETSSSSDSTPRVLIDTEAGRRLKKQPKAMQGDRYIPKELRSLVKQIEMSMSSNRRAGSPFEVHITSWVPGSDIDVFGQWTRVDTWPVIRHQAPMHEVFALDEVVMLSPDAEKPLLQLDPSKVYCVGGIVDRTVRKGLSLGFADRHGITARRLPIQEHAEALGMLAGSSRSPILNVSDVVAALVQYRCTGDWVAALAPAIPERKKRATTPRPWKQRMNQEPQSDE